MKLTCIKLDNKAEVISGKDKGEIHTINCPKVGQKVEGEFSYTGSLIIKGYEKDSEGNSLYFDPRCFSIDNYIEEVMEQLNTVELC